MVRVPEWVMLSFTSSVPPFSVVVPANVPVSDKIKLLDEGIETDDTVKVLVVLVASMANVALLVIDSVEMV